MANGIVLNIDTTKSEFQNPMVQLRQGDGNYQSLSVTVTSNGEPFDLTGWTITFMGTTAGGFKIVDSAVTVTNALQGEFTYTPTKAWGQDQGEFKNAYFKFTKADETASGASFRVNVLDAVDLTAEEAKDYISVVDVMIDQVKTDMDTKLAETKQTLADTKSQANTVQTNVNDLNTSVNDLKTQNLNIKTTDNTWTGKNTFDLPIVGNVNGTATTANDPQAIHINNFGVINNFKQPIGVTFIDKLNNELLQRSVNVKWFGATGDGVTDDTAAIQAAIDSLPNGGTVYVPAGNYMIKAHDSEQALVRPYYLYDAGGIALKSNITLYMDDSATLSAIKNTEHNYNIIRIVGRDNVKIRGGKIRGDLNLRTPSELNGEWGYGIALQGSTRVLIEDVDIQQNIGDAINLQAGVDNVTINKQVVIQRNYIDKNRRQGISVEGVEQCIIRDNTITGTGGTAPEAGIDLEPGSLVVKNNQVVIENNRITNNKGAGLQITRLIPTRDSNTNVFVHNNYFSGNVGNTTTDAGAQIHAFGSKYIRITDNIFVGGASFYGIHLYNFDNFVISGNQFTDSGLHLRVAHNGVVSNNMFNINKAYSSVMFYFNDGVGNVVARDNTFDALGYVVPRPFVTDSYVTNIYLKGSDIEFVSNTLKNVSKGIYSIATNSLIADNNIFLTYTPAIEFIGAGTTVRENIISGSNLYTGTQGAIIVRKSAFNSSVIDNTIYSEPQGTVPSGISDYNNPKFATWLDFSDTTKPLKLDINRQHLVGTTINPLFVMTTTNNANISTHINPRNNSWGSGSTRPASPLIGDTFFDTTINKFIIAKTQSFPGYPSAWVDTSGTAV